MSKPKTFLEGSKKLIAIMFLLVISQFSSAQDLENIKKEDIVKVGGGVSVMSTFYQAINTPQNRDPFMWQVNVNMSANILGIIDAPFSASISSQSRNLNTPQPFNNFGISPKYKAVTAHLGYRSINLSEFTLQGSQFLGVGIEIDPKDSFVKGKALYGRFAKPVLFNPNGTLALLPSYSRMGWGTGLTFGSNADHQVSINMFKAKDDPTSINVNPADIDLRPADNFVMGISTKQKITPKISAEGEFDVSLYTNDITKEEEPIQGYSYLNNLFFFQYNPTSEIKKAVLGSLNYNPGFATFALKYRRVDPGYKTLGAAFINNDYEDILVSSGFGVLKKKLNMSVSVGTQRNNLEGEKVTNMFRLANSVAATYAISPKWNAGVNYANFSTNTRQNIIVDFDSLRFVQTTSSYGGNLSHNRGNDNVNHAFSLGMNYQEAIVNAVKNTTFINGNIGWQAQFVKTKSSLGAAIMAFQNISEANTTQNLGPSVMAGTILFNEKLQLNANMAYLNTTVDGVSSGAIINMVLGGSWEVVKGQRIAFNASNIIRNQATGTGSEITATVNYGYSF